MTSETSTAMLACATLKDEIEEVIRRKGARLSVRYLPVRHNRPTEMREMIAAAVRQLSNAGTILLAYGYCGGGLEGICSPTATLVIPKAHDCIDCLLPESYRDAAFRAGRFFLTGGWLRDEKSLIRELKSLEHVLDDKRRSEYIQSVYGGYHRLTLIDDGAYSVGKVLPLAEEASGMLHLPVERITGSLSIMEKLIDGTWDENFLVVPPGQRITGESLVCLNV